METFVVLDFLPNGHPLDSRPMHLREPIAQVVSDEEFSLLELVPQPGYRPSLNDRIKSKDPGKIRRVLGRIEFERLTQTAKAELAQAMVQLVDDKQSRFIEFFNKAAPLTMRQHSLELIPGIGKKHMWAIIDERKNRPFESFTEMRDRIKLLPDLKKAVAKRIMDELQGHDRYNLFTIPPRKKENSW